VGGEAITFAAGGIFRFLILLANISVMPRSDLYRNLGVVIDKPRSLTNQLNGYCGYICMVFVDLDDSAKTLKEA